MKIRLGVDIACRAAHQASCADELGQMLFSGHRFRTDPADLETLWARLPDDVDEVMVVMEPTRNAWVALAAWFRQRGATVVMVPPSSPPICATTTASTPRPTGWTPRCWPGCPCCTPRGCTARTLWGQARR